MKFKRAVFAILVCGLVLAVFKVSKAVVDVQGVEGVLKKDVLTQEDYKIIDDFMKDAVSDLVRTDDFTQVAKTRTIIVTHRGQQRQYVEQYSESAYTHILAGIQEAKTSIRDRNRQFKVIANLLILIDNLKDPKLVGLAVAEIGNQSMAVRYWAIRAATDAGLWATLGQDPSAAGQLAERIITECGRVADSSSPEVLLLMAEFAGRSGAAGAGNLLVAIAEARIKAYADWSVDYALMDAAVLKQLSDKVAAGSTPDVRVAEQFAQLYSMVMQRYIKGHQSGVLNELERNHLGSVLIETEEKCLGKLLGAPQATIRQAVEGKALDALQREHDRLLGTANQAGALPSKLNFSYGSGGAASTAPRALSNPPQAATAPGVIP